MVSVAEKAYLIRQVRAEKVNVSEPPMRCRNSIDDFKTRVPLLPWDKPGGNLSTALAGSGIEVARARFRRQRGTWERLALTRLSLVGRREGEPQAAETVSGRVPAQGRRADRLVVAVMSL